MSQASACPSWVSHESCGQRTGLAREEVNNRRLVVSMGEGMWTEADQGTLQDRVPLTELEVGS